MLKINDVLKHKFINVYMNDIQISTNDKPIIGTFALGPCLGFVLHSQEKKRAIVGHISCSQLMDNNNLEKLRLQILKIIIENELVNSSFNLMLIEGAQKSLYYKEWYELGILQSEEKRTYPLFEILEKNLTQIDLIKIINIKKAFNIDEIQIVDLKGNLCTEADNEASKQFAFNANNGQFITKEIFIISEKKETKKY